MPMPLLRCTVCENEVLESSYLSVGGECLECEEGELVEAGELEEDEEAPALLPGSSAPPAQPELALARAAARKVLDRAGINSPPVPVEPLARSAGFEIVERLGLGRLSGRMVGTRIEVAPCHPHRRRFVVAHELGHHFLGKPHKSGPHVEQEVNAFAGELLIPGPFLLEALAREADRRALARAFNVSVQALEIAAGAHNLRQRIV
jgi:uncharacterized protein DUF955